MLINGGSDNFKFMQGRPADILVIAKLSATAPVELRKLDLYYTENSVLFSRSFECSAPQAGLTAEQLLDEALDWLLSMVRSRLLKHQDLAIWFFEPDSKNFVQQQALNRMGSKPKYARAIQLLQEQAQLVETGIER